MNDLPTPEVLLFDWDLTLADNWSAIRAAYDATLAEYGMPPVPLEASYETISRSPAKTFAETFGEYAQSARASFLAHFRDRHLAALRPMPGAPELVGHLREIGKPAGIVSNKMGEVLRREVAHFGWNDPFAAVYGSADAAADKPEAAPVLAALADLGARPGGHVWYVGDTGIDIATARNAGCTAVLVRAAQDGPAAATDTAPDRVFAGLADLLAELRRT